MRKVLSLVLLALVVSAPSNAVLARPTLTRVLFLYGSVPPGTDPSEMIHIDSAGRNGYAQLAGILLWEQGHNVTEIADTDPAVNPITANALRVYDLVVFGSNNRRFSQAVGDYVQRGGSVLALSDSRFGPSPDRSRNLPGAGELSDNDVLAQFGMYIEHDNYQVVVADGSRFVDPAHPILAGISSFKGEGVSLIRVDGAPASIVVRGDGLLLTDGHTITGKNYAITAVAQVGAGRVAVTFDRNTFFNAGVGSDGTDIGELDNHSYALNLFDWLTRQKFTQPSRDASDCGS